jgi:hypothetical protein
MKRNLLIAFLVILILSVSAWTQSKPQWEYKIEYNANEKKLNQLAACRDGNSWRLVPKEAELLSFPPMYSSAQSNHAASIPSPLIIVLTGPFS